MIGNFLVFFAIRKVSSALLSVAKAQKKVARLFHWASLFMAGHVLTEENKLEVK